MSIFSRPSPFFQNVRTRLIIAAAALGILLSAPAARADDRVAAAAAKATTPTSKDDQEAANQSRIGQLIRQLGDPRYSARRGAANELRHIGAEAFDQLHAATGDSDPEVAASAQYLLRQIAVRLVQSEDSAAVRGLLREYDRQTAEARMRTIDELAKLPEGDGVAGLCRIARYDRLPLVSRAAALAIIRPSEKTLARLKVDPEVVEGELGTSTRASANWLRQYVVQLRDPANSADSWQRLIDEETGRLDKKANETSSEILFRLIWNLADVHRQLDNQPALVGDLDRIVALDDEGLERRAADLLAWLMKHDAWPTVDEFLARHQAKLEQSKRSMYYAAIVRARQGKADLAQELADKALLVEPETALAMAKELEEQSQFEWAVREYRQSIDKAPQDSYETILSRMGLASLLQDYEHYQEAVEALEPLVTALGSEGRLAKVYSDIQQYYERREAGSGLPSVNELTCRLHHYRACQHRAKGEWQQAREEMTKAIEKFPDDADVLIAMYRVPDADAEWRGNTLRRIQVLAAKLQKQIDADPAEPSNYNQWAWLVSNTEGDYQQAVRYSHRSLELSSGSDSELASYNDTLGRCYFAVGDLENAIKYQQQAIEKINYMQVMHRQLAQFEKALAEKQGASKPN